MADLFDEFGIAPGSKKPPDLAAEFELDLPAPRPSGPSWWDTVSAIPGTTLGMLKQSAGGMIQKLAETDWETQAAQDKMPEVRTAEDAPHIRVLAKKTGKTTAELVAEEAQARIDGPLAEWGRELSEEGRKRAKEASPGDLSWDTPSDVNFWKAAVLGGGSSLLVAAPVIAAAAVSRSPGVAVGGAVALGGVTYGQTYGESREAGLSPERSSSHAMFDASVETVMEFIPLKFISDAAGGPVLSLITGTMLREVPTEFYTTALQSANAKLSTRPDMTWEEYAKDLLDTVGATMVASPLMGGLAASAGRLRPERKPAGHGLPQEGARDPYNPIAEMSAQTDIGADLPEQSAPSFEFPSIPLESVQQKSIAEQQNAIDPEGIDQNKLEEERRILAKGRAEQKAPSITLAELAWSHITTAPTTAMEDVGELGASSRQAANAANYINPNTGDRMDRKFSAGPEGFVGLTPRQAMPVPGTYVLGEVSDDRPAEYLVPLRDSVEQLRAKYLPESTIVLSNEQLFSNSALGWHYTTGANKHMIVPAVLRKASKGWGQYNPNTIASAFYNMTHEFGHALISDRFYRGATDESVAGIRDASRSGVVTPELLAGLPEEQQAVVAEFNALKSRVLDGSMTAEQFVQEWMGPAKIGRKGFLKELKVSPKAPAKQLVNALADRGAANSNIEQEQSKAATKQRLVEDMLSLDEYLAEQTARFAYQKKWDEATPLGRFFGETLRIMRQFFVDAKKDGLITSGTAFTEWLEGLGKTPRPVEERQRLVSAKKAQTARPAKAPVAIAAKPAEKGPKKPKSKVARTQLNVEIDTKPKREKQARQLVTNLVRSGLVELHDAMYNDLMGYANRGEFEEFIDQFSQLTGKTVKFEFDPPSGMDITKGDPDWKRDGFYSPNFKAWFGDWVRDPQGSSKVRVGAFHQDRMGIISVDNDTVAMPLVLFTTAERIKQGGNHFHASSLRGQHYAESRTPLAPENLDMVPVVLNIRNPFVQGDFHAPAPVVAELQAQGYDGIVYQNDLDGDLSFITFKQDQVKVVPDRAPYGSKGEVHLEFDYDQATPEGNGAARMYRSVKNYLKEPGYFRRAMRHAVNASRHVLQMQQLGELNPDLAELQLFIRTNTEYTTHKASRMAVPDKVLDFWEDMSTKEHTQVAGFRNAQEEDGKRWYELAQMTKLRNGIPTLWYEVKQTAETEAKLKEHGIDPDTPRGREVARHLLNIENSLLDALNEDEQILMNLLAHRHASNRELMAATTILRAKVQELREFPFVPRAWFGQYMLMVTEKSNTGPGYEVKHKQGFETVEARDKAFRVIERRLGTGEFVQKKELTDTQYVLMALPADFLDTIATELDLKDEQLDKLVEILTPVKQEKLLKARDFNRLGITGYSEDMMRSYANYTWHHANAQAKMLYRKQFGIAIDRMRRNVQELSFGDSPEYYRQSNVLRAMEGTLEYIMSPPNEWYAARAAISMAYLSLNIKTALANSFGLMLTWSHLTAKHGNIAGEKRFMQAAHWSTAAIMSDAILPKEIQGGLDRAIREGIISQSYAYHLAGQANSSRMWRVMSKNKGVRYGQKVLDAAMFPFRLMELATRRITFIAALKEEIDAKAAPNDAYNAAVMRTNELQNEYSAGNRVPLMRGTKGWLGGAVPMATIFMSFAQHAAFHSLGGYERGQRRLTLEKISKGDLPESAAPKGYQLLYGHTARIWALLFMLAGAEGLPFAENMLDIVEAIWRRFGKKPIRQEMREFLQGMEQDPHLWTRGLMHNVAGFDVSRSVGFGRLFPGTEVLAKSQQLNINENVGSFALDMLGVTGHMIKWGIDMSPISNKSLGEAMRGAPGATGNLWNAYDWSKHGVRGPNGGLITRDRETGLLRDLNAQELLGKVLGFNPTIVSQNREEDYAQWDRKMFWKGRMDNLKRNVKRAVIQDDSEALAEAREAIAEFNEEVRGHEELAPLRISGGELSRYIQGVRKAQRDEERNQPKERKFRKMYEDVRKSWDKSDGEGSP